MEELMNGSQSTFNSRYIVELVNIFRKEEDIKIVLLHKSLLTKIESEFDEEIAEQIILPSSYRDASGKMSKCYDLNFEQSLQILMSESKTVRKKCVEALKSQQEKIKELSIPSYQIEDPGDRARAWAVEYDEKKLLLQDNNEKRLLITEYAPKALAFDKVIDNNTTYTLATLADISGLGRGTVADKLREFGWLKAVQKSGTEATQYAKDMGYAKTVFETKMFGQKEVKKKQFVLFRKGIDRFLIKI